MDDKTLRIGGACGFWGDASIATAQLLAVDDLDVLVYDYLAEITLSIMARARLKDPAAGYAADFVTAALAPNLQRIAEGGVRVISNAGGMNPLACAAAVQRAIAEEGLSLTVAVVTGDDLLAVKSDLADRAIVEMFSGEPFPDPETVLSINAYLGAFPIARALDLGADIVITGRCVDSALVLGPAIHSFGWSAGDLDALAGGSLAGHILECGPQATGGNFTDWHRIADGGATIGYPIADLAADGSFTVTKPQATGGLVCVGTVSEQLLYEIEDPQAYRLPDVICDFSDVRVTQAGPDRVHVTGARGVPASPDVKVSLTYRDGFRGGTLATFVGLDAERKARTFAEASFVRARRTLALRNAPDFTETSIEILGADSQFGANRRTDAPREVVAKIAARHADEAGIAALLREATGLGLSAPPGLSGFAGTRPRPSPVVRLFSFALPKAGLPVTVTIGDRQIEHRETEPSPQGDAHPPDRPPQPAPVPAGPSAKVPLVRLAWGRSGDKGNRANIGIIARQPDYLPVLWQVLTEAFVARCFAHFLRGPVERYLLPGPHAINFVLNDALGGGGIASLRNDPQGKAYAQILLAQEIQIPKSLAEALT